MDLKGLRSRCEQSCFLLEAQGENCFLGVSKGCHIPLLVDPIQGQTSKHINPNSFGYHILPLILILTPSLMYKDLCDYIGPTWILQNHLPISRSAD